MSTATTADRRRPRTAGLLLAGFLVMFLLAKSSPAHVIDDVVHLWNDPFRANALDLLDAKPTVPRAGAQFTLDAAGDVGLDSSITIGADGNPVMSYHDLTNTALKVARCGNPLCTVGNTAFTVDDTGNSGRYSSIAIYADGLPLVAYQRNGNIIILKCSTVSCSGNAAWIRTLDFTQGTKVGVALGVGTEGRPVVAYYDETSQVLKVAKCGSEDCSLGTTLTTVDQDGFSSWSRLSLAVAPDARPVIAYNNDNNSHLKVVKCGNAACSSGNTFTIVDSSEPASMPSIAIGNDGLPVVAYFLGGSDDLKVAKCGNASCSSGNALTIVDAGGFVGRYASLAIDPTGLPVIAYHDTTNSDLKVARCHTPSCSTSNVTRWSSAGTEGTDTSIAIGSDGLPVVSFRSVSAADLKVMKCTNPYCLPRWSRRS